MHRLTVLLLAVAASAAHAELYRWVDPQTGSVTFSNSPPAWGPNLDLGNAEVQAQVQRYESRSADLDRRDPAGIVRRRAEQASVMERLRSKPAAAAK